MKKIIGVLAVVMPVLAWGDAASDAANDRFEQAIAKTEGRQSTFTPRINRLIGWSGGELRALSPSEKLNRLIEAYWAWSQEISPESATFTGYPGQNGRWADLTQANLVKTKALEERFLKALEALDPQELSEAELLNRDLLIYQFRHSVSGHSFPDELMPVNQMFGIQMWVASVLGAQPLFTAADRADFIARLQGLPVLFTQVRSLLEEGLKQGVTPPRVTLAKVPQQFLDLAPEEGRTSPLLQSLNRLPSGTDAAEKEAFEKKVLALYQEEVRPAILAAYIFIRDEYLPKSVRATGLSNLPNGRAWYAHAVKGFTTTDLTPEDIHAIGRSEVKRIRSEMLKVMAEVGFKGSIEDFAKSTKKNKKFYYTDKSEFLRDYRALGKKVDALLPSVFRRFAALPYGIEEVPEFRAKGSSAAYYLPGSAQAGRPGVFYVNTVRMAESPSYEMEALLLHEAVPGHHFQIAMAQELTGFPEFRKHNRFTAYTEGWGLYAESLGPEMGLYQDPYSRFGALTFEMWRAIRLVVDTGMHALGWSREEAIQYFVKNTGRPRGRIEAETDRYLVMPGQALAYKIGQLKIRELRTKAEQVLGDSFDVRDFHDVVLSSGALPLAVLESKVDTWLAAQELAAEGDS